VTEAVCQHTAAPAPRSAERLHLEFDHIYRTNYRRAVFEAQRMLNRRADVDDVVASAFLAIFGAMQRGGGPTIATPAYVTLAVRTAVYQLTRTRKYKSEVLEHSFDDVIGEMNVSTPRSSEPFIEAFTALPPRWRQVLWYTEVEGLPNAVVGQKMGLSANSVAALGKRARAGFRRNYNAAHGDADPHLWRQHRGCRPSSRHAECASVEAEPSTSAA
jgi:RNA polymerase sigma factor (sigma-70 family)